MINPTDSTNDQKFDPNYTGPIDAREVYEV